MKVPLSISEVAPSHVLLTGAVGVPDAEWGELVVAAYPAAVRPDLAKVNAVLSQSLAPAKCPKQFVPLADWPVNAQGKVNRAEVVRLLQAEH